MWKERVFLYDTGTPWTRKILPLPVSQDFLRNWNRTFNNNIFDRTLVWHSIFLGCTCPSWLDQEHWPRNIRSRRIRPDTVEWEFFWWNQRGWRWNRRCSCTSRSWDEIRNYWPIQSELHCSSNSSQSSQIWSHGDFHRIPYEYYWRKTGRGSAEPVFVPYLIAAYFSVWFHKRSWNWIDSTSRSSFSR